MATAARPLAVVTGASTGIGLGIARALATCDHDLVVAADEPQIEATAAELRGAGADVRAAQVDLATRDGVLDLVAAVGTVGQPVAALVLNAGIGVNGPFVETDVEDHLRLIELNVTGAVHLAGRLLPPMAQRGEGRLMVTSSIASAMVGPMMSTYNASKTFLAAWANALRQELDDSGVTVTTLMPGGTDTEFFDRAGMGESKLAQRDNDDPDEVGRQAVEGMLAGEADLVSGPRRNALLAAMAKVLPEGVVARGHERFVDPDQGS
jgi:uncharacterized protein